MAADTLNHPGSKVRSEGRQLESLHLVSEHARVHVGSRVGPAAEGRVVLEFEWFGHPVTLERAVLQVGGESVAGVGGARAQLGAFTRGLGQFGVFFCLDIGEQGGCR